MKTGSRTNTGSKTGSNRIVAALAVATAFALAPAPAAAQAFPSKPVRLVVPFAAGGMTDVYSRLLAGAMGPILGQPVVVENDGGGGGQIAASRVARAPKDGYTLIVVTPTNISTAPHLYKNLPYKQSDFVPVAQIAMFPLSLFVPASLPVNNWKEFESYVRANKGKVSFASTGRGGAPHLAGEMVKARVNLEMQEIPYKGSGPALNDLMAGHVQAYFDGPTPAMSYVKAGKLKALATLADKRMAGAPDVPTMIELGYPGMVANLRYTVLAPAGTPREIVDTLHKAAIKAMESGPLRDRQVADGTNAPPYTPDQLAELLKGDSDLWGGVIRRLGIQLD